jgi:TolB-like protein/DNA-binding winged helix-turn-helix (wHTH) protein/tetratricopeptide (TPR) repeat protein
MASEYSTTTSEPFAIGSFRIDPSRRIIDGPDGVSKLEPKILAVLQMLAARPGEVVTRDEFIESIWKTEYGGDESLTRAISHLRKIFGNFHGDRSYIETVPKKGYRLITGAVPAPADGPTRGHLRIIAVLAVGLAAVLAIAAYLQMRQSSDGQAETRGEKAAVMVAVLPFDIQGGTGSDAPLAFGVADEILSELSRNPSIAVIAGNSSFQFTGEKKKDLDVIGRQLKVSYVIDGSLNRSPQGIRVGVHLIDIGSGLVEWSEVVTRSEDEFYKIPGEVANAVQTVLGTEPVAEGPRQTVPNPSAYEKYLYAKSLLHQPWGENIETAIRELERAVTVDPGLSQAWSTLAITRVEQGFSEGPAKPGPDEAIWAERLLTARQDAESALAIDPESVEAELALLLVDYRTQAASLLEIIDGVDSLVARAPNLPKLNFRMGMLMGAAGRFREALRYLGLALALDPFTVLNAALYADALLCSGQMDDALAFIQAQGVYERYQRTYTGLIMNLLAGNYRTAREAFTNLGPNDVFIVDGVIALPSLKVESINTTRLSQLMERLIDVAESADATTDPGLATELVEAAEEGLILHFYVAQLMAVSGFQDAALGLVERRIAAGDTLVRESGILLRPAFRKVRKDPAVMRLFEETGQLNYWIQTGNWPDYCDDPELPYDCGAAAQEYRRNAAF